MSKVIVRGKEEANSILFRLREDGKVVFKRLPFLNYFYVLFDDWENVEFLVQSFVKEKEIVLDREGTSFVKIILSNNFYRYKCKDIIENTGTETFESDVDSVQRFCTINDLSWQDVNALKVGYFDIETDDRKPMERDFNGNIVGSSCILSCAIGPQKGTKEDIKFFYNKDPDDSSGESERALLKEIFDELKQYDIISAWNGHGFDSPYLRQRQEKLGMEEYFDWKLVNSADDLIIFKGFYDRKYKSYSLNNVGQQFIGKEKLKFYDDLTVESEGDYVQGQFYHRFKNNFEEFKKYNIIDVELMQLIEAKAKNYEPKLALTRISQAFFQETNYNSVLADHAFLRKCYLNNVIAKRQPTKQEKELRKLETNPGGGYTFCFLPGLYFNLEAFDFKSHYPLIMMTFNISPETFVKSMDIDYEELSEIMTKDELDIITKSIELKKSHTKRDGSLKSSYFMDLDRYILSKNLGFSLQDVMFKFIKLYKGTKIEQYAKEHNYIWTPADFNQDTNGWTLHPHRLYKRIPGMFPLMSEEALNERDKVKYEIWKKLKEDVNYEGSEEHMSQHYYQIAVKILGNSYFGVLGAVHTRFYNYDVVDTITTVGKWLLKKSILFAQEKGSVVTAGDSVSFDSIVDINGKQMTIEEFYLSINSKEYMEGEKEIKSVIQHNYLTKAIQIKKFNEAGKAYNRAYMVKRNIKKIIRHKTKKQMYKIITETGKEVVVTEDHSMIVRRDKQILNLKTLEIKLNDYVYVNTNEGRCQFNSAWNAGLKPIDWKSKEQYKKWKLEKVTNNGFNKIGAGKGMSSNEIIAYNYLKKIGFKYEPFSVSKDRKRFIPDFVNEEKLIVIELKLIVIELKLIVIELKLIVIELNGSGHKFSSNVEKKKLLEEKGYSVYYVSIDEKFSKQSNIKLIIEHKLKEVVANHKSS